MQLIHHSVLPLWIIKGESCWIPKRKRELTHPLWPFQGQESRGNSVLKESKSMGWGVRRAKGNESSESRKRGVMLKSFQIYFTAEERAQNQGYCQHLQVFSRFKVHDKHKWVFLSIDMHMWAMTDLSLWRASSHQTVCVSIPKYPVFPIWLWCKGIVATEKHTETCTYFPQNLTKISCLKMFKPKSVPVIYTSVW